MHETSRQQQSTGAGDLPRFSCMTVQSLGLEPDSLDFYQLLLACTGEDAAEEKLRHVLQFRMSGYARASFIGSLAALPAPLLRFPLWRTELELLPGEVPRVALLASVHGELGQSPGNFLASAAWKTAQADIWQSVLALAWTQAHLADAALMLQLTDVLRVGYFLRLLDAGACSLASDARRRAVLAAQLVLPEVVVAPPR